MLTSPHSAITTSTSGLSFLPLATSSALVVSIVLNTSRLKPTNCVDDVHSLKNLAEHDVLAIQPAGNDGGDEELRA